MGEFPQTASALDCRLPLQSQLERLQLGIDAPSFEQEWLVPIAAIISLIASWTFESIANAKAVNNTGLQSPIVRNVEISFDLFIFFNPKEIKLGTSAKGVNSFQPLPFQDCQNMTSVEDAAHSAPDFGNRRKSDGWCLWRQIRQKKEWPVITELFSPSFMAVTHKGHLSTVIEFLQFI